MCIGYLKRQLLRRNTTRWAGEGPSLRSTGGLCCQGQWPGLDGIMAGPTRSVEIVSVQNIKHVPWSFTYWNLWLLHSFLDGEVTLLYVNYLKFIIPPAVAHEATSSVCHFSFFHIRTAFVIGNYLLHTHYILMQTLFFSAAQGRGGTVNIPPFWERLQSNNTGSWNNHSAISCSPLGLPTRSHMENY